MNKVKLALIPSFLLSVFAVAGEVEVDEVDKQEPYVSSFLAMVEDEDYDEITKIINKDNVKASLVGFLSTLKSDIDSVIASMDSVSKVFDDKSKVTSESLQLLSYDLASKVSAISFESFDVTPVVIESIKINNDSCEQDVHYFDEGAMVSFICEDDTTKYFIKDNDGVPSVNGINSGAIQKASEIASGLFKKINNG